MRALGAVAVLLLFATLGCGGPQKFDPGPRGTLRFKGEPRDALIEVDETHLGPIHMFEKHGLLLKPGKHNIILRAEGYFPEYRIVELKDGQVLVIEVELRPEPE
ncbi:MAG: PEGA domain-containing protein [Deltaproteobacteria bacterium]|nr:PEGA domain-containing protein [Deltaproteobacteria bacterium]